MERRVVRLSPIAYDSSLLPSTEARTLFQFQCGCTFIKTSYRSSLVGRYPTNNFTLANRSCSELIFLKLSGIYCSKNWRSLTNSRLQVTFLRITHPFATKSHNPRLKESNFV